MIPVVIYPGTRIKELRLLNGLSQEELGRRVGVQRAAINKYEKNTVTNIPIATIEKIASVFDVSPTYLVGWSEDNPNPLSVEVKVLQGIKHFYGEAVVNMIEGFTNLTPEGQQRVIQYVTDMSMIYENGDKLIKY